LTAPSVTYHPSLAPVKGNRIAEIWQNYQRGKYSPAEMVAAQNAELQPCIQHLNRPGITIIDEQPRCLECYERLRGQGRA
jgi:hypothetical protein